MFTATKIQCRLSIKPRTRSTIKRIKSKVMGTIENVDSERNILKLKITERKCARFLILHITEANKTSFFRSRESERNFYKLYANVNL